MGQGRAPTQLEWYLINKQLRKYEQRDKSPSKKKSRKKSR